jgi:hypothetical protein
MRAMRNLPAVTICRIFACFVPADFASGRAWCGGPPENWFVLRVLDHSCLGTGLNGALSLSIRSMITASLRASATLALLAPARRAIRVAQLLSSEHPLIGLVSMRWAAS